MSKSPFYKTGISKSPFNQLPDNSKPQPELLINRPKPVTGIKKPKAIGMQKGSPAKQVQNQTATYTAGTGGTIGKKRLKGAAAEEALAKSEVMQKKSPSKQKGSPAKQSWSSVAGKVVDLITPSKEAKAARVAGRVAKIERRNARKAARAKK